MKRYHGVGYFIEEQRKGFRVKHEITTDEDDSMDLSDRLDSFLHSYNSQYCHSLEFSVKETIKELRNE